MDETQDHHIDHIVCDCPDCMPEEIDTVGHTQGVSTMKMSKMDAVGILESMKSIQRNAGVTISVILEQAVYNYPSLVVAPSLGDSVWNCEESPVLLCIYDSYKDPAMDECIYCGEPDQRK